jgi:hypothetical protein
MMDNDKIARSLDLEPMEQQPVEVVPEVIPSNVQDDFDFARANMVNIIEKGQEALNDILSVAQQSQQPRSFEVVSDLIRTIAQTNKDLLELSKQKKEIEKTDGPKTVNNNLFVGSTSELLKMLKQNNEQ